MSVPVVLAGDCRLRMAAMAEASIDSIVTDPPYEIGFMGRSWDSAGIAYDVAMWRQALRVLKPGGYLIVFTHARTYHRVACAIEDAGFEIRDQFLWLYGTGMPKGGKRGTDLKPAHEPIVVARKPFKGTIAANFALFGTGLLNIDACRIESGPDVNDRAAKAGAKTSGYGGGWSERKGRPFSASAGRWPANLAHDGSVVVLAGFPATGKSSGGGMRRDGRGGSTYGRQSGHAKIREVGFGDTGSAARFFYCAKASKADRHEGCGHLVTIVDGKAKTGNIHETVKPESLMRYLVRLFTPTAGGLVLDPFTGSGSTGKAAVLEGYRFIGCELTDAYIPIARARIAAARKRACASRRPAPALKAAA